MDFLEALSAVWKSNFTALNRRVVLHAIDVTPARWGGMQFLMSTRRTA